MNDLRWSGAWLLGALILWALWHVHVRPHPVRRRYLRWYLALVVVVALGAVALAWAVRAPATPAPLESEGLR